MLKRFQIIQGVGAFSNFRSPNSGVDFSKNTIIYANNGYGKSTIATILKSAYLTDPQRILARSTLSTQQVPIIQHIVVKVENGTMIFQDSIWSYNPPAIKPEILVFDQQYVFENLFIQKVESEHKQSMHRIIIGHEGVQISEDLIIAKAEEKRLKQLFDERKKELNTKITNTGRRDYLSITDAEEQFVITKLQEIDNKLSVSKEKDELSSLANFPRLAKLEWDFSEISQAININIKTIHESARVLVDEHIQSHLKNNGSAEGFIRQGLEQIIDTCPFCGQGLEGVQVLIRAYQELFDQIHGQAIAKITEQIAVYFKWDPSAYILGLQIDYDKCLGALKKIETHLHLNISVDIPTLDFQAFRLHALAVRNQILDVLSRKEQNLNIEIDTQFLVDFENVVKDINAQIDIANSLYQKATQLTIERLGAIDAQSIQALESRKNQLTESRKRFLPQEKIWCDEYHQLESDFQAVGNRCRDLTDQLSNYSIEIFKKYQKGINEVLKELGVDFKIENLVEQVDKRAKQPFAEFQIMINGLPVTLQEKDDCPCFQNTLSEGEKNTLSFAFFVTYLRQKGDLSNTIVVFDDPLSSMDDYRRGITANIIRDLAIETKQMVVLTHKKDFLFLLSEKLENPQVLTLKKDNAKGSTVNPLNVENERKSDDQKTIERLIRYLDEDVCEVKAIQGDIRICLESALRFKYFMHLYGVSTLGSIIKILEDQNQLPPELIRTLRDLNEISSPVHHGGHDEDPKREMDRAEILPYIKKTLEVWKVI